MSKAFKSLKALETRVQRLHSTYVPRAYNTLKLTGIATSFKTLTQ